MRDSMFQDDLDCAKKQVVFNFKLKINSYKLNNHCTIARIPLLLCQQDM